MHEDELSRKVANLETLHQITDRIASSRNWEDFLEEVLSDLNRLQGGETSSLFLREDAGYRFFRIAASRSGNGMEKGFLGTIRGPAGWVLENGEPIIVSDASSDDRVNEWSGEACGGGKRSAVCVPVVVQDQVRGALEIVSEDGDGRFNPSAVSLMSSVASQLALGIERTLLQESLEREKENFENLYNYVHDLYRWNMELGAIVDYTEIVRFVVRNGSAMGGYILSSLLIEEERGWVIYLPRNYRRSKGVLDKVIQTFMEEWRLLSLEKIDVEKIKIVGIPLVEKLRVGPIGSTICAHLGMRKRVKGMWLLSTGAPERIDEDKRRLVMLAAGTLASALENSLLFEKTLQLARMDGLTGVYNYRTFTECLGTSFERAKRHRSDLSLLMLDVDYFKKFNDTFGHQHGDEVLKGLADILTEQVRSVDIVFRYGGEEFGVLLPDTSKPGAAEVAERIRRTVDGRGLSHGGGVKVTVCIGGATYPDERISAPQDLVKLADKALYKAKREGRNKVRFS